MNRTIVAFLLVSLILLPAIATVKPAQASRTLTVPGSYSTIQQAIDAAEDGDTILVRKGTYNEQLVINKQVVLRGEDKTNTIIASANSGAIILVSHDNVEVTGFTVRHDGVGRGYPSWHWSSGKAAIHLLNVKGCNINDNLIVSRGCGIWLYSSNQNSIVKNTIQECDYGIVVQSSSQNTLTSNKVINCSFGLSFMSASGNVLKNNDLRWNSQSLAISSSDLSGYINDMDASNVLDDKPICYWVDQIDKSVPSDAGCVVLVNCKQVTVDSLILSANSQASITLAGTQGCIVSDNNISGSGVGIQLFNAQYDNIFNNTINTSSEGIKSNGNGTVIYNNNIQASIGISVGGYYQSIIGNTISAKETGDYTIACSGQFNNISQNTLTSAMRGLTITGSNNLFYSNSIISCYKFMIHSDNNVIAKNSLIGCTLTIDYATKNTVCANTITQSGTAIDLIFAKDNRFYANSITNNGAGVGIGSDASRLSGNRFYQNNFIDNGRQIGQNWARNTANYWDNDKEGNYWSDNTKGRAPYEIKSYYHDPRQGVNIDFVCGYDNHPLIEPYDLGNAVIELPQWTDPAKPSITLQPNDSNINKPTTTQPSSRPSGGNPPFPTETVAVTIVVAALAVTAALYLKKRGRL
jgi:parallel beta-helix repeat protein